MRKILTLSLFFLFLASVLVFSCFGAEIRIALSPDVLYVYQEYRRIDPDENRAYPAVPDEAVQTDEDGQVYLWIVAQTDEFPEKASKVVRENVEILHRADGYTFVRFENLILEGGVAVEWEWELREGMRVNASVRRS